MKRKLTVAAFSLTCGMLIGSISAFAGSQGLFSESSIYQTLIDVLNKSAGDTVEYSYHYLDDEHRLYVFTHPQYTVTRELLNITTEMRDSWDSVIDAYIDTASTAAETLETLTAGYDTKTPDAGCTMVFVTELDEDDEYLASDVLAVITEDGVQFNAADDKDDSVVENYFPDHDAVGYEKSTVSPLQNSANSSSDYSSDSSSSYSVGSSATIGEKNALEKAYDYLNYSAFSRSGLIDQLEFEGYTTEEATYAVDHCGADWNEQAAKKAKQYLDYSSFSRSGLISQLEFEGFSSSEAEYGASQNGY